MVLLSAVGRAPGHAGVGGGADGGVPVRHHLRDRGGQRHGHRLRVHARAAQDHAQLLHRVAGRRRPHTDHPRAAAQRHVSGKD